MYRVSDMKKLGILLSLLACMPLQGMESVATCCVIGAEAIRFFAKIEIYDNEITIAKHDKQSKDKDSTCLQWNDFNYNRINAYYLYSCIPTCAACTLVATPCAPVASVCSCVGCCVERYYLNVTRRELVKRNLYVRGEK